MTTIYKVASTAGVSPSTVSRVINQRAGVNDKTVQRVERAMEKINFRPRWKAAPAKSIGIVVFPHRGCLEEPWNAALLSAACEVFFAEGYAVQLIPCLQTEQSLQNIRRMKVTHQVQGVLVMALQSTYALSEQIECEQIPHVAVGPASPFLHHVSVDDEQAGYQAMEHLWNLGHRRVGVVSASTCDQGHNLRVGGIRKFLHKHGADPEQMHWREYSDIETASGESAAVELLAGPTQPTAIIATNSRLALGLVYGCRRLQRKIPDDVSLVGFEDAEELAGIDPPLTVMRQPTRVLGERASRLLIDQLNGREQPNVPLLPLNLIVRWSTAPPSKKS